MAHGIDMLKPLVLDNGSRYSKVGFAGDDTPYSVFDSYVGSPRFYFYPDFQLFFGGLKDTYVGNEVYEMRPLVSMKRPMECGIITDWNGMEKLWGYTFDKELCVAPELHPVLLTEMPLNPKSNREKMTEIMFETFHVPAMYAMIQSVASLYSSGYTTGIVIESGDTVSHTVPIYEGYALPHAVSRLDRAAGDFAMNWRFTDECLYDPNDRVEIEFLNDLIRKCCYVALDLEKELKLAKECPSSIEATYELPCGRTFTLCTSRFTGPETLFQPSMVGSGTSGIHEKANDSIIKCDVAIRKSLYETIVLGGGSTMFPGFAAHISKEMNALAPDSMKVNVIAPKERRYSAWTGASIFASLDTFQQMWISKADYEECGPAVIHRKCF